MNLFDPPDTSNGYISRQGVREDHSDPTRTINLAKWVVTAPYTDENEEISPPNKKIRTLTVNYERNFRTTTSILRQTLLRPFKIIFPKYFCLNYPREKAIFQTGSLTHHLPPSPPIAPFDAAQTALIMNLFDPRGGCITVRLEPLENRNSPRIPTKACPASHRCSLLGSGVIRGLKPPRPCIFPHVDFISCAWTALLGNQSITVRTVGVRGGVEQLQRSCTTSPKRPYHALE